MSDLPTIYVAEVECRRDESRDTVHVRGPGETRGWLDLPHPISTATYGLVAQADGETLSAEKMLRCETHLSYGWPTFGTFLCESGLGFKTNPTNGPGTCVAGERVLLVRGVDGGEQ